MIVRGAQHLTIKVGPKDLDRNDFPISLEVGASIGPALRSMLSLRFCVLKWTPFCITFNTDLFTNRVPRRLGEGRRHLRKPKRWMRLNARSGHAEPSAEKFPWAIG